MAEQTVVVFLVTEDWYFWSHRLALAQAVKRRGHRVVVLTRIDQYGQKIRDEGFDLIALPWRRRSRNPISEFRALWTIFLTYRRLRPDLVHHVALKPVVYGSAAAALARVRNRVNAVAGFGYAFASTRRGAGVARSTLRAVLRRVLGAGNSRVTVQNPDDAEELVRSSLVSADRIRLVRGAGVDIVRFFPRPHASGEAVVAALVSRMLWTKGVGEFVEAARIARQIGESVRFLLVGDPDAENPDAVPVRVLEAWREEGIVEWRSRVIDVEHVLAGAHIGVLPSYREGLPKSLLEAGACGLALVAADVPGCREVVRDGVNGLLVAPRDAAALAEAIVRLARDEDERRRMGSESRRRVVDHFSQTRIVGETLRVYDDLLRSEVAK